MIYAFACFPFSFLLRKKHVFTVSEKTRTFDIIKKFLTNYQSVLILCNVAGLLMPSAFRLCGWV